MHVRERGSVRVRGAQDQDMSVLSGKKLVFLPGLDGTGISFEPFREVLPPDVATAVVRYPADRPLSFEETVRCAREQIPWDEGSIVLAESFSGPVAVALVGSGMLGAQCLILCSTFARPPRPFALKLLRALPLAAILRLTPPRFLLKLAVAGGNEPAETFLSLWRRVMAAVPLEVLVHRLGIVAGMDVRSLLPLLSVPCLYIQAASDRTVPASSLFDFTEAVPDLRVKRIPGPHFILQAQPRASLAAIEAFLGLIERPCSGHGPGR